MISQFAEYIKYTEYTDHTILNTYKVKIGYIIKVYILLFW